jgi:hypothetical protein
MTMSRTWTGRITRWHSRLRSALVVVTVVGALLGAAAGCKVFLAPDRPDIVGISQRVGNQADQVGAFTADFVVTWLTGTIAQRAALRRFVTVADAQLSLPTTPAAVVSTPQVVSVIRASSDVGAGVDLYAVTVSITERAYASADPIRSFYRVPVAMWNYQPRALAMPARINGPGAGADVALGYRDPLSTDSPVYAVVSGFVRAYLTTTGGLDRYVLADAPLTAVGGYQSAIVSTAATDRPIPTDAAPGTRVHVLVSVLAQTSQFATVTLSYPLSVENSGGTWMLAAIDLTPRLADDVEPTPVAPTPR